MKKIELKGYNEEKNYDPLKYKEQIIYEGIYCHKCFWNKLTIKEEFIWTTIYKLDTEVYWWLDWTFNLGWNPTLFGNLFYCKKHEIYIIKFMLEKELNPLQISRYSCGEEEYKFLLKTFFSNWEIRVDNDSDENLKSRISEIINFGNKNTEIIMSSNMKKFTSDFIETGKMLFKKEINVFYLISFLSLSILIWNIIYWRKKKKIDGRKKTYSCNGKWITKLF